MVGIPISSRLRRRGVRNVLVTSDSRTQRTFGLESLSALCCESSDCCKNRSTLTNWERLTSAIEAAGRQLLQPVLLTF